MGRRPTTRMICTDVDQVTWEVNDVVYEAAPESLAYATLIDDIIRHES